MRFELPSLLTAITLLGPVFAEKTMNVVAHPDDDLLFVNPDIQHNIDAGFDVLTVFLTSGDAGQSSEFWMLRQEGMLAAYAEMADVENIWNLGDAGVEGKVIPLYWLQSRPEIRLAFMHIPDGNVDGSGFPATGQESMEQLWKGEIETIGTVDGSGTTYSRDELIDTLRQIIDDVEPDSLNSLDYIDPFGSGDHSDHTSAGLFTNESAIASVFPDSVIAYRGYPIEEEPENVFGDDLARKKDAFFTYAAFDATVCASDEACVGTQYELWLPRQYTAN
ncbi:uncharacterized protein DSM5745_09733 [Aspergillus mulundensis]|uniref:N-acetylglucosaminylphosphatidylinositol deacetylase n=1 Tax=Aspergillus mulundensis TaxID=1810919 RepID=A0A3D8QR99_9EURO|nr:Uncharacterized protein DSM5745_09733 [Aspergillus mulundensis]RDW64322.1 Uncharacterized protein DSM5745_09733 [Aspergillus mulundensis]